MKTIKRWNSLMNFHMKKIVSIILFNPCHIYHFIIAVFIIIVTVVLIQ